MGSESWQSHFCEYSTTLAVSLRTLTVVQMERQRAVAKAAKAGTLSHENISSIRKSVSLVGVMN